LPTRRGPLAPAARPDSWIPPAAPAPPGPRGAAGRGPDSRCRPGLPPRGPRAPPHSHSASRTPDDRQSRLHLGLLWLASGNPGACTDSSQIPSTPPHPLPRRPSRMRMCARTHREMSPNGASILFTYTVGGSMPGSRTAEPYATSTFSSFGNLHNLFHTGSTHAHSYSPWRRVPFAPHLLQHWLLTDIAVRPNRTHVKWSLLGVWS
jgi:hypothetical protein